MGAGSLRIPGRSAPADFQCLGIPGKSGSGGRFGPESRVSRDSGAENPGYPGFFSCRAARYRPHGRPPTRLPPAARTTCHPLQPLAAAPTAACSPTARCRPCSRLPLLLRPAAHAARRRPRCRLPDLLPPAALAAGRRLNRRTSPPLPPIAPAVARRLCCCPPPLPRAVPPAAGHRPQHRPPLLPLVIEPAAGHYWLPLPLPAATRAVCCAPLPLQASNCVAFLFCFAC